jgi:hypothetical protein
MPIVLIIVGLAVAIGLGGYFLRPEAVVTPEEITELPATPEAGDGSTVPVEAGDSAEESENVPTEVGDSPTGSDTETPVTSASIYGDGAHTVNTSYKAPNGANHTMAVTLTLKDDVVTASSIVYGGDDVDTSKNYQNKFGQAYQSQVIGKKLDAIKLSRVGGASLTTGGFNDAIAKVKAVAAN